MGRSITKEKARLIAQKYCASGFNKQKTLIDCGYSMKYSKSTIGHKLFDRPIVRTEIDAILDSNAAIVDVQIEEIIRGLREIAFPSEGVKVNNSDRNRALELLGRYKDMFSDRLYIGSNEQQRKLSETEQREAKLLAKARLRSGDIGLPTSEEIMNG